MSRDNMAKASAVLAWEMPARMELRIGWRVRQTRKHVGMCGYIYIYIEDVVNFTKHDLKKIPGSTLYTAI